MCAACRTALSPHAAVRTDASREQHAARARPASRRSSRPRRRGTLFGCRAQYASSIARPARPATRLSTRNLPPQMGRPATDRGDGLSEHQRRIRDCAGRDRRKARTEPQSPRAAVAGPPSRDCAPGAGRARRLRSCGAGIYPPPVASSDCVPVRRCCARTTTCHKTHPRRGSGARCVARLKRMHCA